MWNIDGTNISLTCNLYIAPAQMDERGRKTEVIEKNIVRKINVEEAIKM